jgi:hypothetical protein
MIKNLCVLPVGMEEYLSGNGINHNLLSLEHKNKIFIYIFIYLYIYLFISHKVVNFNFI